MPKRRSQLDRLNEMAARKGGVITYSKRNGYYLVLSGKTLPLGKDSVDALFQLERLLMEHQ